MNGIYEEVPIGHEGPANLLRSLPHPPSKAFVRFVNASDVAVTVYWIDFDGNLEAYKTILEHEYFDCDTFVDHAWVFKEFVSNDAMCVKHREVFWPKSYTRIVEGHPIHQRSTAQIHRPLLPLCTLAARSVRNQMRDITGPFFLELPFHLQVLVHKLLLEYWVDTRSKNPNTPHLVDPDPENAILRRDFDDFQCNILYICHRLSMHAKKLWSLAKSQWRSSGAVGSIIIKTLETIIHSLGYDIHYDHPEMYTRKLAPVIWKQLIFLRVHLDNLNCCAKRGHNDSYSKLARIVQRRLQIMPAEHKNSFQKYHWEQLSLLIGDKEIKGSEKVKNDPAYDIPELLPLSQRKEWEWIDLRKAHLKNLSNMSSVPHFYELTYKMLRDASILENIFQVLCILHYHITGHHLTEEAVHEEEDSTCATCTTMD